MGRWQKTPPYSHGERKCKVTPGQFIHMIKSRLLRAGDHRDPSVEGSGYSLRMRMGDEPWVPLHDHYMAFASAHVRSDSTKRRKILHEIILRLWGQRDAAIAQRMRFPIQIVYGPSLDQEVQLT